MGFQQSSPEIVVPCRRNDRQSGRYQDGKHRIPKGFIGMLGLMHSNSLTRPDPCAGLPIGSRSSAPTYPRGGGIGLARLSGLPFSAFTVFRLWVAGRTRLCETPESACLNAFFGAALEWISCQRSAFAFQFIRLTGTI